MGGPVVGRSISIKLVLPKSVGDLEIMHVFVIQHCMKFVLYFWWNICILQFVSVTCYCHVHVFGSSSGLGTLEVEVLPAVVAVVYHCALSLMHCIVVEDIFSTHSTFSTLVMDPKTVFFGSLTSELTVFNNGIIIS